MKFLSNAHTHTSYCDGKNTVDEMLQAAKRLGFDSLGFSGHAEQGFDTPYAMNDGNQAKYTADLRKRQGEEGSMRLWVGLEQDNLVAPEKKKQNRQDFDYLIGSTHYLCRNYEGQPISVDGNLAPLREYVRKELEGDMLAMVKAYFDIHVQMILADQPDIIGHFDLVRKHAAAQGLFDPESKAYRKLALAALEAVGKSGCVMEVNTGAMARGFLQEPYPTRELLQAWREMGGSVTLTSDCHNADYLDFAFDKTLRELKDIGYRSIQKLGSGNALWETVEWR